MFSFIFPFTLPAPGTAAVHRAGQPVGDAKPRCKPGTSPARPSCSPRRAESSQATHHRSALPKLVFYTAGTICATTEDFPLITKKHQEEACEKLLLAEVCEHGTSAWVLFHIPTQLPVM